MEKYLEKDRIKDKILQRHKKENEDFEKIIKKVNEDIKKAKATLERVHKKELEKAEREAEKEYEELIKLLIK